MGIFGNLFGGDKQSAFKKFEKLYSKVFQKQVTERDKDERKAFLTRDLLRRRAAVTKEGKSKLILDYGTKGAKAEYTLAELNKMAKSAQQAEKTFGTETKGVPIQALLKASDRADITRAQLQISAAVLYKIHGNILHFRVTASKESDVSFHQVKIRLESWDRAMRGLAGGGDYNYSAKEAAMGRISFNCDCGRHRYWYRYLATIGGFGLDPEEHVFPKIRNPGLKGCCCKHVIKTLATLRMHPIHLRLAKEMENQGKKKGFFTRLFNGESPQEKFIADDDLEKAGKDSSIAAMEKEFNTYQRAKKGFQKKVNEQKKKQKPQPKPTKTEVKAVKKVTELEKNLFIERLKNALLMSQVNNTPRKKAVADFAKQWHSTPEEIDLIAKKYNV